MEAKLPGHTASLPIGCQNCDFLPFCQYSNHPRQEKKILEDIPLKIYNLVRGEYLFRENDTLKTVCIIRSGSVKTYTHIPDGEEQVTGFHLAGKLLGLDGIATNHHTQSAVSLETCSICEISYARIESASKHRPQLQNLLLHAMSREIRKDHDHLVLLSRKSAATRLASFLLSLSHYFQQHGYSATNFNLSMSRHDIANLLGLAVETVSRLFTQFQQDGLVTVDRKHIVVDDMQRLQRLSNGDEEAAIPPAHHYASSRFHTTAQHHGKDWRI
ncbi:MAG: helix-turn-helix domain-containing protein [Gammaproteobacteria bacterium]